MYIQGMDSQNHRQPACDTQTLSVGWYGAQMESACTCKSDAVAHSPSAHAGQSQTLAPTEQPGHISTLASLDDEALRGIQCVIADIRQNARQVLSDCRAVASNLPVIVLADAEYSFSHGYPFGTYVSDVTTPSEMESSVFWHRITRAVQAYDNPLTIDDTSNPVYAVLKAIADQTSDWIMIKDLQHRFVVVGENFAKTAGLSIDEVIGRNDLEIGSSPEAVKGNPETGEIGFWARDDAVTDGAMPTIEENPKWSLYSSEAKHRRTYRVPLKNPAGRVFALLVCSQDITEQVRNQQLLAERTSMLSQVIEEKQRAQKNHQIAEDAVQAKTRFFASASHDLRQPLHAIGLFLDSLDRRIVGTDEHHLVLQIKQSCSSLATLFNSCLDISRLDAGVVEKNIEHFSASTFLEALNDEFRRQAREKSLDYRLTVDDSVFHSDQILLARIVRNLLNNAIQNTEEGYLAIECQRSDTHVLLSVADSGSGIADEELERVFNEFHQINPTEARRSRGLGLGLSIVKRLCEHLGIGINLQSKLGCGSRFTLSVPVGHLEGIEIFEEANGVSLPDTLLALIVEDDQYIRLGMEVLLESYGAQTVCAPDTDSAIQLLQGKAVVPDIIVADYHLSPDVTGIQAIRDIREHLGRAIPALLVTGDTSADSIRDAMGYDLPVLHKPVDSEELLATINEQVQRVVSKHDTAKPIPTLEE